MVVEVVRLAVRILRPLYDYQPVPQGLLVLPPGVMGVGILPGHPAVTLLPCHGIRYPGMTDGHRQLEVGPLGR